MHWHSWPFSDFYGVSNQLPWPSKPQPRRQEGRRCRGHLSTTSLSTRCTFLTALLSVQAKLETPVPTFSLTLSPRSLHLHTWNLSMSMVVFSFLLDAAEKKTVENEHKVLQSRQVVSQYLTLAISLTQTLSLSICGSSGCLFYGHALEWLFITL